MTCRNLLIVVGGDLARSPRMLRHAEAAIENAISVDLIGFRGAALPRELQAARVSTVPSFDRLRGKRGMAAILAASVRQVMLSLLLAARILAAPKPDVILIQTPPLLPVAPLAWCFARLRGARLIVDWHNATEAMVVQRFGRGWVAGMVRRVEQMFTRSSGIIHLCVSSTLASSLRLEKAVVLRDSPPARFVRASRRVTFAVTEGLQRDVPLTPADSSSPPLIVAPSSWSADDDFDLLVEALSLADAKLSDGEHLILAMTGSGERRAMVEQTIERLALRRIAVLTGWLSEPDFIALLGSADAGLSVHRSTSGADIPIKIAEMINCGAHVLALDYGPVLDEILAGQPATLFRTPSELAAALVMTAQRTTYESATPLPAWSESWRQLVLPILDEPR